MRVLKASAALLIGSLIAGIGWHFVWAAEFPVSLLIAVGSGALFGAWFAVAAYVLGYRERA